MKVNRSGYDACDEDVAAEWFCDVADAIASPEGQAFLRELADALDALPAKRLIDRVLINDDGDCCAIGAICKSRGISTGGIDNDMGCVAERLGAPWPLVAEIIDQNDGYHNAMPDARWHRMRRWVDKKIRKDDVT